MSIETEKTIEVDIGKEDIKRQFNTIHPTRVVYPIVKKTETAQQIQSGQRELFTTDGDEIVRARAEQMLEAAIISRLRYSVMHALHSDLACGVYTAITQKEGHLSFIDVFHHIDSRTGKPIKTIIRVTLNGLYKLALGPLVNHNGHGVNGTENVVKKQKVLLRNAVFSNLSPRMIATINDPNLGRNALEGAPITLRPIATTANEPVIEIEMYSRFFPLKEENGSLIANDQFSHKPAALSSIVKLGALLLSQRYKKTKDFKIFPESTGAYRTLLCYLAGDQLSTFSGKVERHENGKTRYRFNREFIAKNLYPSSIGGNGYIHQRTLIEFVNSVGKLYGLALEELNILDKLNPDSPTPALKHSLSFPKNDNDHVWLNAQTLRSAFPGYFPEQELFPTEN